MSTDVPTPEHNQPPQGTVTPTPDSVAVTTSDPLTATTRVPVARVPVSQLLDESATRQARPTPPPVAETTTTTARPASSKEVAKLIDAFTALLRAFPASAIPSNLTAFPNDPAILQQMIIELLQALRRKDRDLEETRRRLDALLRPRPKPVDPDQPSLFPDAETPPITSPAPSPENQPVSRRGQCKPHGRRRPARELRRVQKRYELTAAERLCPDCHRERREIGIETTEQYDYKPAEVFVIEHQQVRYACRCCEGHVAQAPKPPQPIDKGLPGAGLLAQIATDKYLDHIPLNRTEQRFERLGFDLPRSTMCDWMAACAELLTPLWSLLKTHVLQSKVLHTDDTTVPVRDEKLSQHRYGRLWDYIGDSEHPGVVFDYTTSHARDGPATFLQDFRGFLQADAYGAYDGIYTGSKGAIVEVGCWAHARNKFADAQSTDPERVLAAKAWVRRLYDVEDEAKEKSSAERLRLRQEKSVPLLDSFHQWLLTQKGQVLPKSPIATAINYVLNQWEALKRYTTDGDLHIDNNISERTLKLIGMGRVNWLFVGSDKGGRTAAVMFSFTATCKCLGIDSFSYLRDVFARLPTHPKECLEELLPHRWQVAQAAARMVGF